jgi:hypothetical protein
VGRWGEFTYISSRVGEAWKSRWSAAPDCWLLRVGGRRMRAVWFSMDAWCVGRTGREKGRVALGVYAVVPFMIC